ncbi:hypothetical protein PIB30_108205, partial [Stylosanthes scabra]|nr:hypothetical protein [Stylosanthes scabra]
GLARKRRRQASLQSSPEARSGVTETVSKQTTGNDQDVSRGQENELATDTNPSDSSKSIREVSDNPKQQLET